MAIPALFPIVPPCLGPVAANRHVAPQPRTISARILKQPAAIAADTHSANPAAIDYPERGTGKRGIQRHSFRSARIGRNHRPASLDQQFAERFLIKKATAASRIAKQVVYGFADGLDGDCINRCDTFARQFAGAMHIGGVRKAHYLGRLGKPVGAAGRIAAPNHRIGRAKRQRTAGKPVCIPIDRHHMF